MITFAGARDRPSQRREQRRWKLILADYRQLGETVWRRFHAGKQDQLWFYRSVVEELDRAASALLTSPAPH